MVGRCMMFALMTTTLVVTGCSSSSEPDKPTTRQKKLSAAQEAAVKDYVTILEKHIQHTEEAVDILSTVSASKDSWQMAATKMSVLSNIYLDKTAAKLKAERPSDPKVLEICKRQVQDRLQKVQERMQAEIRRIVSPEVGGADFFEKELRPALKGVNTGG
jgi:outer membrane murein-binding lipoprotein Lpp